MPAVSSGKTLSKQSWLLELLFLLSCCGASPVQASQLSTPQPEFAFNESNKTHFWPSEQNGTHSPLRGRKRVYTSLMAWWVRADGYFLLLSFDSSAMLALSS
jgi:hypothetical protein